MEVKNVAIINHKIDGKHIQNYLNGFFSQIK